MAYMRDRSGRRLDSFRVAEVNPELVDDMHEWWIDPIATLLQQPSPRQVKGGLARGPQPEVYSEVRVSELSDVSSRSIVVGKARVDDHNAPAVWARDGHRIVVAWTNHGQTGPAGEPPRHMHVRVSDRAGTLSSLQEGVAAVQTIAFGGGSTIGVSYSQLHLIEHLSTLDAFGMPLVDYFWGFTRYGNTGAGFDWRLFRFRVDQRTGAVSLIDIKTVFSSGLLQMYMISSPGHAAGDQIIRIAVGYNPEAAEQTLQYWELNASTGALTSPHTSATANVLSGVGLPVDTTTIAPLIPDTAPGNKRRLSYVSAGPFPPMISIAEWPATSPETAVQKIVKVSAGVEFTPDEMLFTSSGVSYAAGAFHASFQTSTPSVRQWFSVPPGTPGAVRYFCRRASTASSNRSWMFRFNTDRTVALTVSSDGASFTAGGATSAGYTSTIALPDDAVGVGFDRASSGDLRFYYTVDGTTWVQLGAVITGTVAPHAASTAPIEIGTSVADTSATSRVTRFEFRSTPGGAPVASQMVEGRWQASDPQGRAWTYSGTTLVPGVDFDDDPVVTDLGVAGEAIGLRYHPMPSFPNPCLEDVVVRPYSDGNTDRLAICRRTDNAAYQQQIVLEQATSSGRVFRPFVPVNGTVDQAWYIHVTHYDVDSYEDWQSDARRAVGGPTAAPGAG